MLLPLDNAAPLPLVDDTELDDDINFIDRTEVR